MTEDPVVRVGPAQVLDDEGEWIDLPDAITVTCTGCGDGEPEDLTDWHPVRHRHLLIQKARAHATEVHDGLVVAEGWVR